jgi:hypothetical protein
MPAFTFEKLPPPARRESAPADDRSKPELRARPSTKPHRGLVVQMLDRFANARRRRAQQD